MPYKLRGKRERNLLAIEQLLIKRRRVYGVSDAVRRAVFARLMAGAIPGAAEAFHASGFCMLAVDLFATSKHIEENPPKDGIVFWRVFTAY